MKSMASGHSSGQLMMWEAFAADVVVEVQICLGNLPSTDAVDCEWPKARPEQSAARRTHRYGNARFAAGARRRLSDVSEAATWRK